MPKILFQGVFIALLVLAGNSQAETPVVDADELQPAEQHQRATQIINHILKSYHYKLTELDDALSAEIFDNYLESLDPNRSYFTQADIDSFGKYRTRFDDMLRDQRLEPVYEIFKVYRQRVKERIEFAKPLFDNEYDFTTDARYQYDRRESPWAADQAELNELWQKRVKNDILLLMIADKPADNISDTLTKRYDRIATSTFQLNADDVFQTFINAYTTAIEPHTAYFSPRVSENFDISMRLSLEGIGAVLSGETDYTEVQRIVPGGPADLSNELHPEDRIIAVGQEDDDRPTDVIGWRLDDVVDLIRGPKGSKVTLEILPKGIGPEGPSKTIELVRNKINLEQQAAKSSIIETDSGNKIGIISLAAFYMDFAAHSRGDKDYRSTTRDVRKLINEFRSDEVDGIVIDLRGNGGGSLTEALELTGLFIESGPIVQTKDASGRVEINHDPDSELLYAGPLAVLVDRNSASASEIFAGAIQDYRRGIIIGEPTFGKGTVQNIVDLNRFDTGSNDDLGKLKTTIAQFFRVSGGSNQYRGVIPDILYPIAESSEDYGERAYANALPWDSVEPARYQPAYAPIDKFDQVRKAHKARIAKDQAFTSYVKRNEFLEDARNRKTVSLNIEQRKAERDQLVSQQEDLDDEYKSALADVIGSDNDDEGDTDKEDNKPDILLKEAARILDDLILPNQLHAGQDEKKHRPTKL